MVYAWGMYGLASILRRVSVATCVTALLCSSALVASAQDENPAVEPESPSTPERPWNDGVSVAERETAQSVFEQGNRHFERSGYSKALSEYRKAIQLWDHPAIRYNMAICLMHLDQPIEAAMHLAESLQHGEEPIGSRLFSEGQLHKKNLAARLAIINISTKEAGAKVSLDGEEVFVGPGSVTKTVLSKKHQVVGSKPNMLTVTRDFQPEAGAEMQIDLKFVALTDGIVLKRRWAPWKPWSVVAGGSLAIALGGTFYLLSRRNINEYDKDLELACPAGCLNTSPEYLALQDKVDTADRQNKFAIAGGTIGGVALATGIALVFLNEPRGINTGAKSQLANGAQAGLSVSPPLGPNAHSWVANYGLGF